MNTDKTKMIVFSCPNCLDQPLVVDGAVAFCEKCRCAYSAGKDWIDVSTQVDYYWGELERPAMQKLIASPGPIRHAMLDTIRACEKSLRHYLQHYAFSPNRAAWKFLLSLPPDATILDVGCGWGALSLSLAEHAACMVVADIVPDRVKLTLRRLSEEGGTNVKGVVTSGLPHLPLPEQSVDLVIVNGVLEWVPAGVDGDPEELQQAFLNEIGRVLKPTGQLYLGIENRYGAAYFHGKEEEHTRLPFISLLPRFVGRLYHRLVKKAPYRAYTYGRHQLETRLRKAGFAKIDMYSPYPDYREFDSMVAVDDARWVRGAFSPRSRRGKIANWIVANTGLFGSLTNSFGVVAHRGERQATALYRLLTQLRTDALIPPTATVLQYRVRSTGTVSVIIGDRLPTHLLSLPLEKRAETRLRQDMNASTAICSLPGLTIPESTIVPDQWLSFEGRNLTLTSCAQGHRLHSLRGKSLSNGVAATWRWITDLHGTSCQDATFELMRMLPGGGDSALGILSDAMGVNLARLLNRCEKKRIRVGPVHGDFHSGNVFITGKGDVERVVDWDLGVPQGLPLWDPLTFILRQRLDEGASWARAFQFIYDLCLPSVKPTHPLSEYKSRVGLGSVDIVASLLTLPIVHLAAQLRYTEQDGREIIDGTLHVLDTGRTLLLDAVLSAEDGE